MIRHYFAFAQFVAAFALYGATAASASDVDSSAPGIPDGDPGLHYTNPVIRTSLPDPTVMRADDGYFYLFATEDTGSTTAALTHDTPVYRSPDLVSWQFIGTAFTDLTHPSFLEGGRVCAPDINYIDGKYVLYYSLLNWNHESEFSTWTVQWEGSAVGVAVADSIGGPYRDLGKLFISTDIDVQSSIDQVYWEEEDGSRWLFWGSYHGIYAIPLSDDGLSVREGAVKTRVAGLEIEGTMICKRNGYYYMIGSTGSCCNGAKATYRLVVARSESLLGPYVDKDGLPALSNHFSEIQRGSGAVLGPGHCSEIVEDDAGQSWLLYHGYQAHDWEAGRVLYMSQLQWDSEGWPYVVGGRPAKSWDRPLFSGQEFTYTPAEYMECTGGSAEPFDTGYVPGRDTRIEVVCRSYPTDGDGKAVAGAWRTVFCAGASKSEGYAAYVNQDGAYWGISSGGYINDNMAVHEYGTDCTISVDRSSATVCGRAYPVDDSAFCGTTGRLTLFGGAIGKSFCGRIYSLRIYEGGTLVRDYRPVVRNEDGMPMFRDTLAGGLIRPYDPAPYSCASEK